MAQCCSVVLAELEITRYK